MISIGRIDGASSEKSIPVNSASSWRFFLGGRFPEKYLRNVLNGKVDADAMPRRRLYFDCAENQRLSVILSCGSFGIRS